MTFSVLVQNNYLYQIYTARIDPRGSPAESYGYWLVVFGTVVALTGIAAFIWGSTFPRGTESYWIYRQAGIALAASGLPIAIFGITFRLPLQPIAAALAGIGVVLCATAVAWFLTLYPTAWTFAGPRPVIMLYTGGITVIAGALTIVPLAVEPADTAVVSQPPTHPYYELRQTQDGWQWQLFGTGGVGLAESTVLFPDRKAARTALDELSIAAPFAGVEVSDSDEVA